MPTKGLRARVIAPLHPLGEAHSGLGQDDDFEAELLPETQLLERAKTLGHEHRGETRAGSARRLRRRFRDIKHLIRHAYALLAEGTKRRREPSPAELWLLDNSHIVESQLREIDEDLPWGYLVQLPKVSNGPLRGYPLVFVLCWEYLRHTDWRLDVEILSAFVNSYQAERTLSIGEIWAVPIMLRLGLVAAVGAKLSSKSDAGGRDLADQWAERLLVSKGSGAVSPAAAGLAATGPAEKGLAVTLTAGSTPPPAPIADRAVQELGTLWKDEAPSDAFLVTLLKRLREREDAPAAALDWIAAQTDRLGTTPDDLARRYHVRQAADQVSVGNAITSMRSVNSLDWRDFFEATSHVDALLRQDPQGVYGASDEPSRDASCHAVERLARRSRRGELEVAQAVLDLCRRTLPAEGDVRSHVGYYLLDEGREELARALGYVPRLDALRSWARRHRAFLYLAPILLGALLGSALGWAILGHVGAPQSLRLLLLPVFLLASSEIAVSIVNAAVVTLLPPRLLSKMDFGAGIPERYTTFVVVPTLLDSEEGLTRLVEELEVRSLANPDDHLYFALLTDFRDADEAVLPGETELLESAREQIAALNEHRDKPHFFLFHRRRVFDRNEQRHLGWERKRGKLAEFNRLLRGATDTTFEVCTAPLDLLRKVRFVITLDTDTELPMGTARKLVAALAHPLNRPVVDAPRQRIGRGHALIQPRVGTSPMSARRSAFARLAAGPPGIDPYTTAVSDVYQDLFGEGSFVGKGIYDVDAFESVMAGRVPENQLLSHDLFESIYGRSALASDIEVLDEQPSAYGVAAGRQHRWTRGDWQLLPWLLPRVPTAQGTRRNDFRPFDVWRVADNLRRSLLAPALIFVAVSCWMSSPQSAVVGTGLLLAVLVVPILGRLVFAFARTDAQLEWLGGLGGDLRTNAAQALLNLIFLLDQAWLSLDAVVRSLYRQLVSRQGLLEWTSMREASSGNPEVTRTVPRLVLSSVLAAGLALLVIWRAPGSAPVAAPVIALWCLAPWVDRRISRVRVAQPVQPWGEPEAAQFRRIARKTWRFFEEFVSETDHFLPPDNYQEDPKGVVAHRTSPTNIGLYLLSVAAARDLGFISLSGAVRRWTQTLTSIERLEKWEGHVLNWYDTTNLSPLEPRYVSTVDSGNLAAYLWTLAQACREACESPWLAPTTLEGTLETARLAQEELAGKHSDAPSPWSAEQLARLVGAIEAAKVEHRHKAAALPLLVGKIAEEFGALGDLRPGIGPSKPGGRHGPPRARASWVEALAENLLENKREVEHGFPHLVFLAKLGATRALKEEELEALATLRDECLEQGSPSGLVAHASALQTRAQSLLMWASAEERQEFERLLLRASAHSQERVRELETLAERAESLAEAMNFTFLYDQERSLFSIGYSVNSARLDNSHYDLLASEARLASLVAIAKGDVPPKHWFRLGRMRSQYASMPGLLSWSGSMFEYLMPLLVTRSYPDTLLDQTCHAAIECQRNHGENAQVPWGVSEAAYNVMDLGMNYQYRAFGVPELGLKPGLGDELVVAPYATALAALVCTRAAATNFEALERAGLDGDFGFYESVDYTPSRLPPRREKVIVRAFMAHHQGMTLVALSNLLTDFSMQRRFHADARIKACALLLEERIPARSGLVKPETPRAGLALGASLDPEATEQLSLAQVKFGEFRGHLLGQGEMSSFIAGTGEGFLTWRGIDISRFRQDGALDSGGIYVYVRNLERNQYWSSGLRPSLAEPNQYKVTFSIDKVEMSRRDGDIETLTEITLSPEFPAEIRRITLINHGARRARLDLTSFTELSLAPRAADVAHPAFQKLFVELNFLPHHGAVMAHRRRRSEHDPNVWAAQLWVGAGPQSTPKYGFSRREFLGRGGDLGSPVGLGDEGLWARDQPSGLDPAWILRHSVELEAGEQATLSLLTLLADSRSSLENLLEQFRTPTNVNRAFEFAWADARVELRHLGIKASRAHHYQRLLSVVLFPTRELRSDVTLPIGRRGRDTLWSQGISGDLPLVVVRLDDVEFSTLCKELLLAHEYWRHNGVPVDLLLLNEEPPGYLQPTHEALLSLIRSTPAEGHLDQRGGVHVRRAALIGAADLEVLLAVARVVLRASAGSLPKQLQKLTAVTPQQGPSTFASLPRPPKILQVAHKQPHQNPLHGSLEGDSLLYYNGIGGFSASDGRYVLHLSSGQRPPQPWSNVMANPSFGTLVTEAGSSFTWFENSQKHRLTPWSNDSTLDPSGELFFVRDVSGGSWSLTPGPSGGEANYLVQHTQGMSSFEHERSSLWQRLEMAVHPAEAVKVSTVRLRNDGSTRRQLRVYACVEWVLGGHREALRASTITEYEPQIPAIFAHNPLSPAPEACAFFGASRPLRGATGDRREFFGTLASREHPAALRSSELRHAFGAGLDPCAVLEVDVSLEPGEETEFAFVLGAAKSDTLARDLARRFCDPTRAMSACGDALDFWREQLGPVRVDTPDEALNLLINHWLPYQVLSCRFWGRSAFFQSGGAYGYRDQLQDSLALLHLDPALTRAHLILSASRQFQEGDVQHWWHPDTGEGVRTRCSDDLLWLPWAALEYVKATGDQKVWDESIPFLKERLLEPGEDDLYTVPHSAAGSATLYEHCVRALLAGNTSGPTGLPLMGSGDWNDGMNRVGQEGRGESVWLAWFLCDIHEQFADVADTRGDKAHAGWCRKQRARIAQALDAHAWDGSWYRRASFDDGSPLGSSQSGECQIDAIAQSWAVIAGAGNAARARAALDASLDRLWNQDERLMALLEPPFAGNGPDPGYIAAYPPGIRENGGQYTHGVLWTVLALLKAGRAFEGYELLSQLSPIRHSTTPGDMAKYQVEPYVVAADVYSKEPYLGRGGWTWYTGSASWMYRITLEWLLGLKRQGDSVTVAPCIPPHWERFKIVYRAPATGTLEIHVENPDGVSNSVTELKLEGRPLVGPLVPLPPAGQTQVLVVVLGAAPEPSDSQPTLGSDPAGHKERAEMKRPEPEPGAWLSRHESDR